MKKKLLSLVLAGAMVASTSVSAFAATSANTEDIQVQPTTASEHEVNIQGNVESSDGEILPSAVTVTVPTSASFTVKSNGELESAEMSIVNRGGAKVSVIASSFIDTTGDQGIKLVKNENDLSSSDRSKVCLKLIGGDKQFILTSETKTGNKVAGKMYDAANPTSEIQNEDDAVIKKVNPGDTLNLKLEGKGSKYEESQDDGTKKAISDKFKLVLKIKQERQ